MPDADRPLVEVLGLDRSVESSSGTVRLLEDVNLSIRPGERIGLSGPSGSGKSLTLRAIAMLDPVVRGEIRWHGSPVPANKVPQYRRQVCYVPQRMATFEGTVRETLRLPFALASWSNNQFVEEEILEWLAVFQRGSTFLHKTSRELSGGEFQLVRLMMSILGKPNVLLLDEPTSAMDAEMAACAEELIENWIESSRSRAFVWISHSETQLDRICTRRLSMNGGCLGVH